MCVPLNFFRPASDHFCKGFPFKSLRLIIFLNRTWTNWSVSANLAQRSNYFKTSTLAKNIQPHPLHLKWNSFLVMIHFINFLQTCSSDFFSSQVTLERSYHMSHLSSVSSDLKKAGLNTNKKKLKPVVYIGGEPSLWTHRHCLTLLCFGSLATKILPTNILIKYRIWNIFSSDSIYWFIKKNM